MRISIQTLEEHKHMSVADLLDKLEAERKAIQDKEELEFSNIREKYTNVYLKGFTNNRLLGKSFELLHIKSITDRHRTTEWNFVYDLEGTHYMFSKRDLYTKEITNSFSLSQLEDFTFITEEEYDSYVQKYNTIVNELAILLQ